MANSDTAKSKYQKFGTPKQSNYGAWRWGTVQVLAIWHGLGIVFVFCVMVMLLGCAMPGISVFIIFWSWNAVYMYICIQPRKPHSLFSQHVGRYDYWFLLAASYLMGLISGRQVIDLSLFAVFPELLVSVDLYQTSYSSSYHYVFKLWMFSQLLKSYQAMDGWRDTSTQGTVPLPVMQSLSAGT